jgi:hypothetical protein
MVRQAAPDGAHYCSGGTFVRERISWLFALSGLVLVWFAGSSPAALAAPPDPLRVEEPRINLGYDISFPQCKRPLPDTPFGFIVIGVTGGSAFTTSECLREQFEWARKNTTSAPGLYFNLNGVMYKTYAYALDGPKGKCRKDFFCEAYNYGYNTAKFAYEYASDQDVTSDEWWLDVEWMNYWPRSTALNDVTIQAAIDFMVSKQVSVGIYSTQLQWTRIAGKKFVPQLPSKAHIPLWLATAADRASAPSYCSPENAFAGGIIWYVQYPGAKFDENVDCFGDQGKLRIGPDFHEQILRVTAVRSFFLSSRCINNGRGMHARAFLGRCIYALT